MKAATVALIIRFEGTKPSLVEILSDDREIILFDAAVKRGEGEPLAVLQQHREDQAREENEFGDYVEELLSQPFLSAEIQEHGVQWLKSKIRIEKYQKNESEAAKIIADFAYKVFLEDPTRDDFSLQGPTTQVRIRVFVLGDSANKSHRSSSAA